MQQEVGRKFFPVSFDGLVENLGFDAVEAGEVGVEDHALTADRVDEAVERIERDGRLGSKFAGARHGEWRPVPKTMRKRAAG